MENGAPESSAVCISTGVSACAYRTFVPHIIVPPQLVRTLRAGTVTYRIAVGRRAGHEGLTFVRERCVRPAEAGIRAIVSEP